MTDSTQYAVEVRALEKSYPGVRALAGVSFTVACGEIFGLVGPDGAGKTTAMRILASVLTPDAGAVVVAGCALPAQAASAREAISYMPQRFGLYEDLTVEENIRFCADLYGVKRAERVARSAQLLKAAGMSEFQRRLAGKLSGGMKQKLALVCALIHRPRILLLDEPTTGVDPVSRRDFWRILYDLAAEGVTILTTTAYLDEAERCHRVALMQEGKLLFCDTPAALKRGMRKSVLSVVSREPRRVREALQGAEGVSSLLMTGDGVHLVVEDGERRIPALQALLQSRNLAFDSIQATAPSIEDLFVDAVQRGDAHA